MSRFSLALLLAAGCSTQRVVVETVQFPNGDIGIKTCEISVSPIFGDVNVDESSCDRKAIVLEVRE